MKSPTTLAVFCLFLCWSLGGTYTRPRESIPFTNNLKMFREEGIANYATMMVREDLGVLLLGAREAIYALDMHDITKRKAEVYWEAANDKKELCTLKGKDSATECRNYIRTLLPVDNGRIRVCGTNAYSPTCDYMTYSEGKLQLEGKQEDGRGLCPFDPFQRHTSMRIGNDTYSATAMNFLGTEPVFQRSSITNPLRTEFRRSWLNEPVFVHMDLINESVQSIDGDDDKVYLFFLEKAVEFEHSSDLIVSRVARVCKGDMGGERTLQKKWTSFLKARLDCPLLEPSLPSIVKDVYLLKDQDDWRNSVFYAVFTSQSPSSELSAVCSYRVADISRVFEQGRYKTPVHVEAEVRWVTYTGAEPVPRPGACINNVARNLGVQRSKDLPDKTLQFAREHPLMEEVILPLAGRPLVLTRGAAYRNIVVERVRDMDGVMRDVMFIGTDSGSIQKAVNYQGEGVIIEDRQLFKTPQPVHVLRLSSSMSSVYAGSEAGAVQVPVSDCGRYSACVDCVLARDPYCGWDLSSGRCSPVASIPSASTNVIQDLEGVDTSRCLVPEVKTEILTVTPGSNVFLWCSPRGSSQVNWYHSGQLLRPSKRHFMSGVSLFILEASPHDSGTYLCESVEQVKGGAFCRTVARYELYTTDEVVEDRFFYTHVSMGVLVLVLACYMAWELYKHFNRGSQSGQSERPPTTPHLPFLSQGGLLGRLGNQNITNNNNDTVITIEEDVEEKHLWIAEAVVTELLGAEDIPEEVVVEGDENVDVIRPRSVKADDLVVENV